MQEKGRSMVEMLGVLAIIGVLSIGAMSGYAKAMFKYKLNRQAEQLSTVFNAVARNVYSFNDIDQTSDLTNYFIKLGEFPDEMIHSNTTQHVYDIFNTQIGIQKEVYDDRYVMAVYMYPELRKKSSEYFDICKNMVLAVMGNSGTIHDLQTYSGAWTENDTRAVYYGDAYCNIGSRKCISHIALEDIEQLCTKHLGKEDTGFYVSWRVKK